MVMSNSRMAYTDCFDLLDKAIADARGIRIKFESIEQTRLFRLRLHNARKIDRKENFVTYGEGSPMAGRSIYDGLIMRIRKEAEDIWWLRVEKLDAIKYEVESLTPAQETTHIEAEFPLPVTVMKRRV